ncbi:MAG TPA: EAL domain-containing protein, partial [Clostridiales bacterium]|nr:EAL domain-containing protein [Clostridiales bacterium]
MDKVVGVKRNEGKIQVLSNQSGHLKQNQVVAFDEDTYRKYAEVLTQGPVIFIKMQNKEHWPVEYVSDNIRTLGYAPEEWIHQDFFYEKIIHPEDIEFFKEVLHQKQNAGCNSFGQEYRILSADGQIKWVYHHIIFEKDQSGQIHGYGGYLLDITDQRKKEENWRMAQIVFENTVEGIVVTDLEGTIQWVNAAFTKITGYTPEEAIGKNPRILKSERHSQKFYEKMWNDLIQKGRWQGEIWNRRKNGETYPEWMVITTIYDVDGNPVQYVSVFNDITEHMQKEQHIQYQAYHDALTGLPNRNLFKDRLNLAISHAHKQSKMLAVMLLDLDRFKRVNDTLSYALGDILLQSVAERLKSLITEGNTVARLSADEFIFLIEDIQRVQDVIKIANRILHSFEKPFVLEGYELYVSASLGISIYPLDGDDAEILMKKADISMHWGKEKGGNTYRFYTLAMDKQASAELVLENDLFKAIEKNELYLCYQPQIDIFSKNMVGAEALVRWRHPKLGEIPPSKFIPLAERNGFIIKLGEWVLRKACEQLKRWHQNGCSGIKVAVNLSALQFRQKNLINMVMNILKETNLKPGYLEMEITESSAMKDPDFTIAILKKFTEMGIEIAIDDFGTGYSSLAYLKRFPLQKLKIDRSFIQDLG